jgi:ElaB/YqjD/DUF883 family membrane-anchored ribosome-binding protein
MTDDTSDQDRKRAGITGVITGGGMASSGIEATAVPEQPGSTAPTLGGQARSANLGTTAQDLGRRAREQASMATDALYQQGARAGKYLTRNVHEYPFEALLIAGAIGYGLGFLIHTRWHSDGWAGNRSDIWAGNRSDIWAGNRSDIEQGESLIDGRPPY